MLKAIEIDPKVKEALRIDPAPVVRQKPGKAAADYVSGAVVVDILNKAFDYAWDWEIKKCWIEQSEDFVNRYEKDANGNPTVEPQPPVAHVLGTLYVHMKTDSGEEVIISKSATGAQEISGKVQKQESIYKSADTDALKRAARLLGVCLKLWRKNAEGKDDNVFYEMLVADELWTPEEKEAHKEELEYLHKVQTERGFSDGVMDQAVQAWSQGRIAGMSMLTPDQVTQFTQYIRESVAQSGGAA